MEPITWPGIWRHARTGDLYRVLFTAIDAINRHATDEVEAPVGAQAIIDAPAREHARTVVVYVSLATGKIYTRPETEFHDRVDPANWSLASGRCPGAVNRFTFVGASI